MGFNSKQISLAVIPKFTGLLSLMGSSFIFQDVLKSKTRRSKVYHRLLFGLSVFDMMASTVNFFSTWPIPAGTPNVFGASGTTQTCTAQGFFNETGNVCTPLYNASLCIYYVSAGKEYRWFSLQPLSCSQLRSSVHILYA